MTAQELIAELQSLVDKNGDKEVHIYKSFDKETVRIDEVIYDEGEDDIYLGIY